MMTLEQFLFSRIAEEASEIAQAAMKCVRFTPEHKYEGVSNVQRLKNEMADLEGLKRMMERLNMLTIDDDEQEILITKRLEKELHYLDISQRMGQVGNCTTMAMCTKCEHFHSQFGEVHCQKHTEIPQKICIEFAPE